MIIKFLGTGTSQGIPVIGCECDTCTSSNPKDIRLRSSVYIEKENVKILIDTGPDLRQQFLTNKIYDLDAILLTHEHNDHTSGLDDIRPINFKHNKFINVYSIPRVLTDIKSRFSYAFAENPYPGSPKLILSPIEPFKSFEVNDLSIFPIEYDHGSLKIIGFRIDNFAYITDVSNLPENALECLNHLGVLVISALQKIPHHSHFSLDQAIEAAIKINAQKTYFIHMSHTMGKQEDWEKLLPEKMYASFDSLELDLN